MVKDDFWPEPADRFSDLEVPTNQGNTPIFDYKVDAAQSSQLAINEDTTSSSQPPIIPKTSLSAPIIFEDIWGDDIGEPTFTETSSSIDADQTIYTDAKLDSEWVEDEELLDETDDDETSFNSHNEHGISTSLMESPLIELENRPDLLAEFEHVSTPSVLDNELEQDFLLDDIELLDIDVALAELDEEELSLPQAEKKDTGVLIGRGNISSWMGSWGLFYINWECGEEAEQEALKRLGYAELEISEATRTYVIQAARAARLPRRQEQELTMKLEQTRLLRAQLPKCRDPENDPYTEQRAALNAEIADLERTLVSKMQWVAVKKATQFVSRGIDLDDLIQYGMLGVIAGVRHYDINKNTRLLTAISWWVFQSLSRAVAEYVRLVRVPVYISEILTNIKKQHTALQMSLSRFPTRKELADACYISIGRLEELLCLDRKLVSLDSCRTIEYANEGYSFQPVKEKLVIGEEALNDEMDKLDMKQYVEAMLQLLSMRERQVIKLRYELDDDEDERTLEEIGKILHITRERVRQIEERAFKKFRKDYFLTRKIWNDYFLTEKKVIKVQDTPQKIEENTLKAASRHTPKQSKTAKDRELLPKVNDAKSQRSILEVEGHTFEEITSQNGFILRGIPD
jgi:RNA polymerase sigma factor (sigma-70 family)